MSGDCRPRAWRHWLLLTGLWVLALLPAFFLRLPLPPDGAWVAPALWLSFSGSKYGLPLVALSLFLVLARNRGELYLLVLPALLFLVLGAAFNEHLLKPWMNQPRPNIEWLGSRAGGPVLAEGAAAFYRIEGKAARSRHLAEQLARSDLALPRDLSRHWIDETGFSFPSGHAFASAALGGWLLFWMLCWRRRTWLVSGVVLWGVGVSWSRLVLGVHRPQDVLAGTCQGLLLALLVVLAARWWLRRARGEAAPGMEKIPWL